MPGQDQLTDRDYCEGAKILGCDPAAIKAVATVESGRDGAFDDNGRLLIRFEGHKFRGYTNRKYDRSHPHLSYRYSQRRGKPHGYTGFNEAFTLDPTATLLSTSYGMFQPMGFNYEELGYSTVHDMVDDLRKGARAQLMAFCRLLKAWGLDDEMQRAQPRDFTRIAKRYNGPAYRDNDYDGKMTRYYRQFKGRMPDCEEILASASEVTPAPAESPLSGQEAAQPPISIQIDEAQADPTIGAPEPPAKPPPSDTYKVEDLKPFCVRWAKRVWGAVGGVNITSGFAAVSAAWNNPEYAPYFLLGGGAVLGLSLTAAIFLTIIGGVILYRNRIELNQAFSGWIQNQSNPVTHNYNLEIEKK